MNHFSLENLHINFLLNWSDDFPLWKYYQNYLNVHVQHEKKRDTLHNGTLPTGLLGYIERSITTIKPPHYRIVDQKRLILSIVQISRPHITDQKLSIIKL